MENFLPFGFFHLYFHYKRAGASLSRHEAPASVCLDAGARVLFHLQLQKCFAGLVDIARADGQDDVARPGVRLQVGRDALQTRAVDRARDLRGQIRGADAHGVLLARGVDIGQHRLVDRAQLVDEVLKQRAGPGIGVRLEGADDALVVHQADCLQQRVQLVGMVGIIVIDIRAAVAALILEPAARAMEAGERGLRILAGNAEFPRHRAGGQRVQRVVAGR